MRAKRKPRQPSLSEVEQAAQQQGPDGAAIIADDVGAVHGNVAAATKDAEIAADKMTVTAGAETYCPPDGGSFEVGPISVSLVLKPGEDLEAAYARARKELEVLFQADYAMKRYAYAERVRELQGEGATKVR